MSPARVFESRSQQINKITCVFVHGWAMNAAVWDNCAKLLPDWIDAVFIDLPGHGGMHDMTASSLDEIVTVVAAVASKPVVWVGWSLGGLVCQRLAVLHPEKVRALFLVASTPKFVRSSGWETAMDAETFDQFAELFRRDISKTIKRFIALQLMGTEDAKQVMQELDKAMSNKGLPEESALALGLDILRETDLRSSLLQIDQPVAWLLGAGDMLVPRTLAGSLSALKAEMPIHIQQGAGHAPFISHPEVFTEKLCDFLNSRVSV